MKLARQKILIALCLVLLAASAAFFVLRRNRTEPVSRTSSNVETQDEKIKQPATLDNDAVQPEITDDENPYDIDSAESLTVVVNKNRPLPADYTPADLDVPNVRLRLAESHEQMQLRAAATQDLEAMFAAAQKDGTALVFGSGYRSYALQKQFYDSYVARDGQAAADRYSARPGTSEHQTGLSFDATAPDGTCHLEICFEDTPQGQWLAEHAHRYGFILRYPDEKEAITGYQYEPWHFRYVGKELAGKLYDSQLTLEEFFNLD